MNAYDQPVNTIRAAGGVPWRRRGETLEVLLVHRRDYDDWTFPKGKVDSGESDEQAALREVEEETGLSGALGDELPPTSYDVRGVRKRVRWWTLEPENPDGAHAQNEVDNVAWLTPDHAVARLSYPTDRDVLAGFLRLNAPGQRRDDSRAAPEPDRSGG